MKNEMLGPPIGYVDMLDAYLRYKAEQESVAPRDKSPLRPSAAGYCTRRLGYEFAEYRGISPVAGEVKEPAVSRLLDLGSSVEYHIIKQFERIDPKIIKKLIPELKDLETFKVSYKQQSVSFFKLNETDKNGFPEWIEGSVDLVFLSNSFRCILDAKSKKDKFSKGKGWKRTGWDDYDDDLENMASVEKKSDTLFYIDDLVAFLDELDDPFLADNFYQLNLYAMTDFIKERGIDHGAVLQYCKNDSRMRELRFRPSQVVADLVKLKFSKVAEAVDVHSDPSSLPRDYNKSSMRCRFCPYKERCWSEGEDE